MKILWNNFKTAFAMFSRIPMPKADWNEENMKYMMCFFPWIGLAIGAASMACQAASGFLGLGQTLRGALLTLLPVFLTGGIHLDGLMDTADALASWQSRERRLEILKDSHTGAFAVLRACSWFLLFYGCLCQLGENVRLLGEMALCYVLSRTLSALGVLCLPKASSQGTVAEFSRKSSERRSILVLGVYLAALLAAMVFLRPLWGAAAFLTAVGTFFWYRAKALKYFGGTNGDLSGYFLCSCELAVAFVLACLSGF